MMTTGSLRLACTVLKTRIESLTFGHFLGASPDSNSGRKGEHYPTPPAWLALRHLLAAVEKASAFRNDVETSMNLRIPHIPGGLLPRPEAEYFRDLD